PAYNLGVMAAICMLGLIGMTFFMPYIGLLPVALLVVVMYLDRFFQSHYLNKITASHQRATVLSFKGLSFNLAYGLIGILYALLLAALRPRVAATHPDLTGTALENSVFIQSIGWFPWYFMVTLTLLVLVARRQLRNTEVHKQVG
ncbi:MAG: MFS transporter, partial [Desulfobacterales bacterium]